MLNDELIKSKLKVAIHECDMHSLRLNEVKPEIQKLFPITLEEYGNFSKLNIMALDQFIYRFTKLQDSMGQHLFPTVLLILQEDIKRMSFIDILNKLEKLELLPSKDDWLNLRNLRNQFAHEYGDDAKNISVLNSLFERQDILLRIYEKMRAYVLSR